MVRRWERSRSSSWSAIRCSRSAGSSWKGSSTPGPCSPRLTILGSALTVFGSLLSVGNLWFAAYQWREGKNQARINAAVELSRVYLVDREIPSRYALFLDDQPKEVSGNYEPFLRARSYLDFLDYIAVLQTSD